MVLCNLLILIIRVMHLIRHWLTNQNVIVGNDVLAEMQTFADAVNSPHSLRELALEVLQLIPDKVQFLLLLIVGAPLTVIIGRHY